MDILVFGRTVVLHVVLIVACLLPVGADVTGRLVPAGLTCGAFTGQRSVTRGDDPPDPRAARLGEDTPPAHLPSPSQRGSFSRVTERGRPGPGAPGGRTTRWPG